MLNPQQFDYQSGHQPTEDGAPLHEVGDHFPDIYSRPNLYASHLNGVRPTGHAPTDAFNRQMQTADREAINSINAFHGKPDAPVTIYRAMPQEHVDAARRENRNPINPGDWVSTSREYAKVHAAQDEDPSHDWPVVSTQVPAKHVRTPGDSIHEWGYYPD